MISKYIYDVHAEPRFDPCAQEQSSDESCVRDVYIFILLFAGAFKKSRSDLSELYPMLISAMSFLIAAESRNQMGAQVRGLAAAFRARLPDQVM